MPTWLELVLRVVLYATVLLFVYNILRKYVLNRFKPNKWIILAVGIAVFFIPSFAAGYYKYNMEGTIWQLVQSGVFIILFLWFMDLSGLGAYRDVNKKDDYVIKPKAKPNRVKNQHKKD